ncbi:ABC transporter substrate-binding protein [Roseivivax sediminis]|uniref:ABC transporter, substrate binding protein, PQQ-dependent alcohol dehydrogenase system n=1 Tax=Roseivivax sediminis TaxID=936889 RepID=A0A1I1U202_9RHOB|nr:ABC transporter substrate-binding protein [Roseivivax sediminis]SFD62713.1 ABC transporter, substrate binding protein, PQQ-dependent alcohol dehydrogenase system [Roseivivax sediminis]
MKRFLAICAFAFGGLALAGPAAAVDVRAAVLRIDYDELLPISRYEHPSEDVGFAGARLADEDNGTTGQFLGHTFETETVATTPEDADAALDRLIADGVRLFVILAEAEDLLRLTDRASEDGALVFNALARDAALRSGECRANLLHTAPSHNMMADAVAQFAIWKQWEEWLLVSGSNPEDRQFADALRNAATKFGAEIVEEREFEDTGGARRTDSGIVQVQRQLPTFMQDTEEHDVVMAADRSDVFAEYLPYHQWTPRPVMGSGGLVPVTMHGAHEFWGAMQLQSRFDDLGQRYMREEDYDTWLALRVVGEAVTRISSAEPDAIRDYALSDDFELAAFKGQPVTFRTWNGQMRQPILLYDGRITVSVSPQDGFLHQRSPLDSMGLDAPESDCSAFE